MLHDKIRQKFNEVHIRIMIVKPSIKDKKEALSDSKVSYLIINYSCNANSCQISVSYEKNNVYWW